MPPESEVKTPSKSFKSLFPNLRLRNADTFTSTGGNRTPTVPVPAAAIRQASGKTGGKAATKRVPVFGKPTTPLNAYPTGSKPGSDGSRTAVLPTSDNRVHLVVPITFSATGAHEFHERDLGDKNSMEHSGGESDDGYDDDELYEAARGYGERVAMTYYQETLTEEELEALRHHQFQKQQEAFRQPKSDGSSSIPVLGIGAAHGASNDKPQTSKGTSMRRKLAEMEFALQQANGSAMNLDHHYRKLWARSTAQAEELQRSQDQVHRLTHDLEAVKSQLTGAKTLSDGRGKEATQVFLTKADPLSTTDVAKKVGALNEAIFLAAALLGDLLQKAERTGRTQEQMTGAFEKAKWMLGERMVGILAAESVNLRTGLNPLLVQIVLQIAFTTWCRSVVSSWKPGDTTVADFLSAIYSEIRETEDQAISGRWRSITRAHLRSSSDDWTENLMSGLLSVLVVAGWSTREPYQQHQFERRLPSIFEAVQDLRKALGEDVTSMDMDVIVIEFGEPFNPAQMENEYGDARLSLGDWEEGAPEKISGTTGLGLQKITMKRTKKGTIPLSEMVLFPRVALERTLKEVMDTASTPTSSLRKQAKCDGDGSPGSSNIDGRN